MIAVLAVLLVPTTASALTLPEIDAAEGMEESVVGTAPAASSIGPQAVTPTVWDMPEGVQRVRETLFLLDADGNVTGTGLAAPGRTFFYAFVLENTSDKPVTVTGFESNFKIAMHPDRQGDFPDDHCLQFFETRDFAPRQVYPRVIAPGETAVLGDNVTYHYIRGPVSNECQQATFYFGPPSFLVDEEVAPAAPAWRDASCEAPAAVTIPEARGVAYLLDGEPVEAGEHEIEVPGEARVTAEPESGFAFGADAVVEWTRSFAQPECGDKDPEESDDPDPVAPPEKSGQDPEPSTVDPVVGDAPRAAQEQLAVTGAAVPLSFALWGAAGALLGAVLLGSALLGSRLRGAHSSGARSSDA